MFGRNKNPETPRATGSTVAGASPTAETRTTTSAEASASVGETKPAESIGGAAPVSNPAESKKNRPTPKRSTQQAARRQPLVPQDRRVANRQAKDEIRKQRDQARVGVMQGDERYLTPRDRGPQRRYVRDFVDARWSISEFFIPMALLVLIAGMFGGPDFQLIANVVVYGVLALVVLECVVLNYSLKSRMAVKFDGKENLERGLTFYSIMRSIQIRRLRIPKPRVTRGQFPE